MTSFKWFVFSFVSFFLEIDVVNRCEECHYSYDYPNPSRPVKTDFFIEICGYGSKFFNNVRGGFRNLKTPNTQVVGLGILKPQIPTPPGDF
jgi:hypothetical protein